jgi:uncharacterized membrane protein
MTTETSHRGEKVRPRVRGPGHLALALSTAGLGILCLVYGDFTPDWQPVPPWFPRHAFAYASGAVLLSGGVGVLLPRLASRAALALTAYQAIWVVAVVAQSQKLLPRLTTIGAWLGVCESLGEALAAALGCFTLWTLLVVDGAPPRLAFLGGRRSMRTVEVLFGASCVAFGLAHFAFADFTATMIPSWLPARTWLVYATGACHIAAGLALITTVFARVAATLEAIMLGSFVLLVHVPSLASSPQWAPSRQLQWTELCLALLIAGSAALLARSLRNRP